MVIENHLSADGTNKFGSYFNPTIPFTALFLKILSFCNASTPTPLKVAILMKQRSINDDDIIDIRHNMNHNDGG